MSSSSISYLTFIGQQVTIYIGCTIIFVGVLGNIINILVFLSLKTFRESSCAFYLTIMSVVNIGQLLFGLLSRVMINGFAVDWSLTSLVFCKFRGPFTQLCSLMSYSCLCLATIDQYFATCTRPRWQQWCNIKLACRLMIISFILAIIVLIPYPIFYEHIILTTGKISCTFNHLGMLQYRSYFVVLFVSGYIPDFITVLFAIMAYSNIQQLAYRTVPLVRRELDKQLTSMVLVQVIINLFTNIPCVTTNAIMYATSNIKDTVYQDTIQFSYSIILVFFYMYFASSFYIYMCVSERFRRQFIHVFCVIHLNRCRQQRIIINQVAPTREIEN